MKKILNTIPAMSLIAALAVTAACNVNAFFYTQDVTITNDISVVSRGHICAKFSTSEDAWYVAGIMKVNNEYDPENNPDHFMTLVVDSLYRSYLDWRYDYLKDNTPYVADFASHCLKYGDCEVEWYDLTPETDYWVYSFVIDPDSNSHAGSLFLNKVRTSKTSTLGTVYMMANVISDFVYTYALDGEGGNVKDDVPYLWAATDSVIIADKYPGRKPEDGINAYMEDMYSLYESYGILDNVVSKGKESIDYSEVFEDNDIVYIMMATVDAGLTNRTCYRCVWKQTAGPLNVKEMFRETD